MNHELVEGYKLSVQRKNQLLKHAAYVSDRDNDYFVAHNDTQDGYIAVICSSNYDNFNDALNDGLVTHHEVLISHHTVMLDEAIMITLTQLKIDTE